MKKSTAWLEATHLLVNPGKHKTGIGYYTDELIKQLVSRDNSKKYTVFGNVFFTNPLDPIATTRGISKRILRIFPGKVWNQLIKQRLLPPINFLFGGTPDVVVFFNFVRLPILNSKTITVIHDLCYEVFPEFVQPKNRIYLKKFVPSAIKKSSRIVAISQSTKNDIVRIYDVPMSKIDIVYPGVNFEKFDVELDERILRAYGIRKEYFLYIGTLEPRKNITGIINAYSALPAELAKKFDLVLAGGSGWNDKEIKAAISSYSGPGSIILPGYIEDKDLVHLYKGAICFVFPSRYEGFGMPIAEAMASGVPVITSRNSSLPEVAGEAALYVDPDDIQSISDGMQSISTDSQLRKSLVLNGKNQVKKFSWNNSAYQLQESIDRALLDKS